METVLYIKAATGPVRMCLFFFFFLKCSVAPLQLLGCMKTRKEGRKWLSKSSQFQLKMTEKPNGEGAGLRQFREICKIIIFMASG